jgi:hypothetical protein
LAHSFTFITCDFPAPLRFKPRNARARKTPAARVITAFVEANEGAKNGQFFPSAVRRQLVLCAIFQV